MAYGETLSGAKWPMVFATGLIRSEMILFAWRLIFFKYGARWRHSPEAVAAADENIARHESHCFIFIMLHRRMHLKQAASCCAMHARSRPPNPMYRGIVFHGIGRGCMISSKCLAACRFGGAAAVRLKFQLSHYLPSSSCHIRLR